jgi:hypothetical protein
LSVESGRRCDNRSASFASSRKNRSSMPSLAPAQTVPARHSTFPRGFADARIHLYLIGGLAMVFVGVLEQNHDSKQDDDIVKKTKRLGIASLCLFALSIIAGTSCAAPTPSPFLRCIVAQMHCVPSANGCRYRVGHNLWAGSCIGRRIGCYTHSCTTILSADLAEQVELHLSLRFQKSAR